VERQAQTQERARSRDEGMSKGKGIDPHNWGDIDVSESKMDYDAQYKALKEWAEAKNWSQRDRAEPTRLRSNSTGNGRDSEEQTPNLLEQAIRAAESQITKTFEDKISQLNSEINKRDVLLTRQAKALDKARLGPKSKNPVEVMVKKAAQKGVKKQAMQASPAAVNAMAQIAPKSYLGHAFDKINKGGATRTCKGHSKGDPPSDSSSSGTTTSESEMDTSSTTSSESSESTDSTTSSDEEPMARKKCASKKNKQNKKHKSS
jgi:hypothetical protein